MKWAGWTAVRIGGVPGDWRTQVPGAASDQIHDGTPCCPGFWISMLEKWICMNFLIFNVGN